jgi:hypothetical protein
LAELVRSGDVDLRWIQLVADAYLVAERRAVETFHFIGQRPDRMKTVVDTPATCLAIS